MVARLEFDGKNLDHISKKVAPKMDPKWAEVITVRHI